MENKEVEKMENKEVEYARKILAALEQLFNEESEFSINEEEFLKGDNFTRFIHALANIAPTHMYNKLTECDKDTLDFNHLANDLCFQYMIKE